MLTPQEVDKAMFYKWPVIFDGCEYAYIEERSYRIVKGKRVQSLWLVDKNKHCIVHAPYERVELKEIDI